jgi:DNA invertase Pin-like site-specific DNA recombinase
MELTDPERQWMAQKTVEPFYQTVLKAFNAMTKEDRRRIITSTRQQMKRDGRDIGGLERVVQEDPEFWDRMAEEGIGSTYESASPEQRLMMGPLMEELQRRVQGLRR